MEFSLSRIDMVDFASPGVFLIISEIYLLERSISEFLKKINSFPAQILEGAPRTRA